MSTWQISMSSFSISNLVWRSDKSRTNGIHRPFTHEDCLQPDWIRRRGSPPTVRILCESGLRIKILESGFGNQNPDAFALLLVQFADPDHIRIQNYLHLAFRWLFFMDLDPRIRVRVPSNSFFKIFSAVFWEKKQIRASRSGSGHVFTFLELLKGAVRDLRRGSGTIKRRGTAQHRRTDPASTTGSAFQTVRYAAAFEFSLAHR